MNSEDVHVHVIFGHVPQALNQFTNKDLVYPLDERQRLERPWIQVWQSRESGAVRLRYEDGIEFVLSGDGSHVSAVWPQSLTFEDAANYFLGFVSAFLLRRRGILCLHAAAVAVGRQAIAFVGPSGFGKSTLAAAFVKSGYPMLSDDALSLISCSEGWIAVPSHCLMRLSADSAGALFGDGYGVAPINPYWGKHHIDLRDHGFQTGREGFPLSTIYILSESAADSSSPIIGELTLREAVVELIANASGSYLLDREMRAQEFSQVTRLVRDIPVRLLRPPADLNSLERLRDVILADQRGLVPKHAQTLDTVHCR